MTYVHTYQPPEPVWTDCPRCHGAGWIRTDDDEEEDCPRCDGNEGWYVWPEPSPSLTVADLDAAAPLPRG